ncbi:MAG TPA: MDR family MFS transporter [Stellaceae bacterium]|nr:MDR family MFS transporter [Stellaceae bacterium]
MTAEAPISHRAVLRILSGVLLGMFLAALDQTVISTALPTMAADLSGVEHLSWVVAVYLLTSTASTPIYGKLSDLYGRRSLLQGAITIFVGGSMFCAIAQSMPQLILARAVQGLGGGGLITLAHAVIADHVSPRERGRYQGYLSGVWATASVGGPVLGGFFVDHLSWRWVFWINLPIGALAYLLCWRALRHLTRKSESRAIDFLGACLLTSAVASLLLVATWGGSQFPWLSLPIIALGGGGLALLALFLVQELRAIEPILPPRLFRNDVFRTANCTSFLVAMVLFGTTMLLPIFLQIVSGMSPGRSGMLMAPFMGATVVSSFITGRLMRSTGRYKRLPIIGLSLATLGLALLATMTVNTPVLAISSYLAIIGMGFGFTFPVMLVSVQNAADPRDIGVASSAVNFFRSMGGSFGAAILWSVLIVALGHRLASGGAAVGDDSLALLRGGPEGLARLPQGLREAVLPALGYAFHVVFASAAGIAGVALAVAATLQERPLRTNTTTADRAAAD